mmetsp:Transcript_4318/g.8756  ORF Transcript_4318/g.8756 Transcript_4318/m.8756 type:complete len:214 (-) Transcript_4318:84-725(-)
MQLLARAGRGLLPRLPPKGPVQVAALGLRSWPAAASAPARRACGSQAAEGPELEELKAKVAELKEQLKELTEKTKHTKEDGLHATKRHVEELDNESKYGITKFAKVMLQIPDNLERAAGCVKPEDLEGDQELQKLQKRVSQMTQMVHKALGDFGVSEMKCLDQTFDPEHHEAMFAMPMPGKEPDSIFHVMEPGYMIHDRTLRAAKVGVCKAAE